jgi:F-type H+-transporting ATPase subunit delta
MTQNGNQAADRVVDVGAQRIAATYALALFDAAQKRGQSGEVLEELESLVHDVFPALPMFEGFLASRAISRKRKPPVIRSALQGRASDLFLNFLLVLNNHERLDLLRPIRSAYRQLYEDRNQQVRVRVRSAAPLPDDQRERLIQELRTRFEREPILETRIDPSLLGGLVVQVGDWLYDGSVRSRLAHIRNQLIERSSYEIQSRRDRFRSDAGD